MEVYHNPVLLDETIESLAIKPDGIYIDGTAGGGGHSSCIAARLTSGRLICVDRDPDAIAQLRSRLGDDPHVTIVNDCYSNIPRIMDELGIAGADGILLDIGVSSHQLDCAERGFSFHADAPLDMRMAQSGMTAADLIAQSDERTLASIFTRYGEEKFASRIAAAICRSRQSEPIVSTLQLAEIIKQAVPAAVRRDGHPARKVFQALRIAVNDELGELERGLEGAFSRLNPEGRLAIITFHSLEDRMVKQTMAQWCTGCTCPPEFPVCVCGKQPLAQRLTKKPIEPSPQELEVNARSRSSKLRVCIKK